MKTAFLVLGAQRSGTSVMSHMLSKFGVSFGNPRGYIVNDLMSQPLQTAGGLADFFQLNSNLISEAAAVINDVYYHHQCSIKTGNAFVDRYYKLLCSRSLCSENYLNYRKQSLIGIS